MINAVCALCFWDGREVSEAEYLRMKFCWCGERNAPYALLCQRHQEKYVAAMNRKSNSAMHRGYFE